MFISLSTARPPLRSLYGQNALLVHVGWETQRQEKLWPHYERMEARCDPTMQFPFSDHQGPACPGWNCTCGIWARKEENPPERWAPVWGEVSLWGKVIRYSGGYRAQYAYPKHLYVADGPNPTADLGYLADALSEAYGVPCEARDRQQPKETFLFTAPVTLKVGEMLFMTAPSGVTSRYFVVAVRADGTYLLAPAP